MAVDPTGVVTSFGFCAAFSADQQVAETFLAVRHRPNPRLPSVGSAFSSGPYVADKGFEGEENHRRWLDGMGCASSTRLSVTVATPGPSGSGDGWPASVRSSRGSTTSCSTPSASIRSDLTSWAACGLGWQRERRCTPSISGSISTSVAPPDLCRLIGTVISTHTKRLRHITRTYKRVAW